MAHNIDDNVFVCFSLSTAHGAIFGAVKLQFLMALKVSLVFFFANATLSIMQEWHL